MDVKRIQLGMNVNIQRSDGRVHLAAVSVIDIERRLVGVEWFEAGDTKGKEVDLDAIFSLNPELRKPLALANRSSSQKSHDSSRDVPVSASIRKKNDRRTVCNNPNQSISKSNPSLPKEQHDPKLKTPLVVGRRRGLRSQSASDTVQKEEHPRPSGKMAPPSRLPSRPPSRPKSGDDGSGPQPVQKKEGKEKVRAPPRKSNCVKEVEKMQKQREERRAKQKDQISKIQEYDPTNPNWEFLRMIVEHRSHLELHPLNFEEEAVEHKICVCVRKRPLNAKERNRKEVDVVTIPDHCTTLVHEPKQKVDLTKYLENQQFRFDYSFDESSTNDMVYKFTAKPLVRTIFNKGMATCFAYGQTGSGKTHTMGGTFTGKDQDARKGIYAMATADVFKLLKSSAYSSKNLIVCASFFEIYCGKVFDLLNKKKKLRVMEDHNQQVQVVGLTETEVTSVEDVLRLIALGNSARTSGTTSANQHSSRSHAIFQLILRVNNPRRQLHGKFSLIDLAGNERGADTSTSDRQTRMEGAEINKSLLALKECIRALGRKGAHLPFRGSVLTQVLRDSFVGDNSRTCMIAMVSPGFTCCEHTLNTLRYADRVKELGPGKGEPKPSKPAKSDCIPSSPIHSDLAELEECLKESGDPDSSLEVMTFHEAVLNILQAEEALVDAHKEALEVRNKTCKEEERLVALTDDPDYNRDDYVQQVVQLLQAEQARIGALLGQFMEFQEKLVEEETASKKVKRLPFV